jgi:hypothetical protein
VPFQRRLPVVGHVGVMVARVPTATEVPRQRSGAFRRMYDATGEGQETFMAADQAKHGWWARYAERRADRRQRRAWRRERRKGSIDSGSIGAQPTSASRHGQVGPAGQQDGAGGGGGLGNG